ncbi:hypothetical protein JL100_025380 [Skermanella mucosa]|uniref:hypothetical protein n=1 Tax=Skermanella mucosa TaxID=1789672 RepID=UPI00192B390C|nr:hypothetical protein [Skermanella mucosa]UEM20374.1 hypothetical protein JL100_025380 [Skermanella mucosa]
MADETFHQTQHDLARTLIRTFYEALAVQFERKDHITRDELDRAFTLIEGFWPKTLPAFKANCRLCLDKHGARAYNPDARRKDFLTRFVFSLLITNIPSRMDPISGKYFPQVIVRGIQRNVTTLFSNAEYEMLNSQAQAIFATIGTDDDTQMWPLIRADETMSMLADKIFIRMLLRFRQFNHQRQTFTAAIVGSIEPSVYKFTDQDFCTVFEVMFSRYESLIRTPEGRIKMDVYYGDGTADGISSIFFAFEQFKKDLAAREGRTKGMLSARRR